MQLALKYWGRAAVWTGILLVVLVLISLLAGQGVVEVTANLPNWAGLALALAAFPAGVAVSPETFPEGRLAPRRIIELVLAAAAVSLLMLTLGNYIGPAASRALGSGGAVGVAEPARMSLGELSRAPR